MMEGDREKEDNVFNNHWITQWEQQCIESLQNEPDTDHRLTTEKEQASQKLWHMFQNTATAIAQLYKDRQQGVALWVPFQTAAGSVTALYKEALEQQKHSTEIGIATGIQRRNRDLLNWAKKRRHHIRREDLITFLANKVNNQPSNNSTGNAHHSIRTNRGSPRSRMNTGENYHLHVHRTGLPCPRFDEEGTNEEEADFSTFREALALSSLNGAMSNVGLRGAQGNSPQHSHSRRNSCSNNRQQQGSSDLSSYICDEFNRHGVKRNSPCSSPDVTMHSPGHKRPRLI